MKFWVLDCPIVTGPWAFCEPLDAAYGDAARCPSCDNWITSKVWLPPYRVRLVEGTKTSGPGDLMAGPGIESFIASDRFIAEFERAQLSGIARWEPVEIDGFEDYEGNRIERDADRRSYKAAFLPIPTTRVNLGEMQPVFKGAADCPVCARVRVLDSYHGVVVDEASWTGDDIVRLTNLDLLMVTGRFAEFFAAGEYTGAYMVPAESYAPNHKLRSW